MTYGSQYEILVDRLRSRSPADSQSDCTTPRVPKAPDTEHTSLSAVYSPSSGERVEERESGESRRWWLGSGAWGQRPVAEGGGESGGERGSARAGAAKRGGGEAGCGGCPAAWGGGAGRGSGTRPPGDELPAGAGARSGRGRGGMHWSLSTGFASGAIVPNNLPESLLCQAYYNPAIIMIVEALLDPKGYAQAKRCDRHDAENDASDDEDDAGSTQASMSGVAGLHEGGDSFLAQISPPRRFFAEAMFGGSRPNFQVPASVSLSKYPGYIYIYSGP